jgi:hypothetical protein
MVEAVRDPRSFFSLRAPTVRPYAGGEAMINVIGETGLIAAEVNAGIRRNAARSGQPLDPDEMYTVRYRTYLMQRRLRTGDEGFR